MVKTQFFGGRKKGPGNSKINRKRKSNGCVKQGATKTTGGKMIAGSTENE